jgi:hypothetical protein
MVTTYISIRASVVTATTNYDFRDSPIISKLCESAIIDKLLIFSQPVTFNWDLRSILAETM